jgi:hypothetical protein
MTLAGVTYCLVDLWCKSFSKIRIHGPIVEGSELYSRIIAFRSEQNKQRAPYLEETYQTELETRLGIDERSLHFAIERDGKIVACVRATPLPFELSALANEFSENAKKFQDYYEFGRLCTDLSLERKGFYAGMLVVRASQYLFSQELAKGILGICKIDRVPYMQKLGLQVNPKPVHLPERKGHYQFIHASKDELIAYYFNRLFRVFSKNRVVEPTTPAEVSAESLSETQSA